MIEGTSRRSLLAALAGAAAFPYAGAARALAPGGGLLTRLAWAGCRIDADDVTAYIDPVPPLPAEQAAIAATRSASRRKFVLITHGHADHFDADYIFELIGESGVVFCHKDIVGDLDLRRLRSQTVEMWEPIFIPRSGASMVACAVPAVDGFGAVQTSWIVRIGAKRLIHCGDTLWHGEFVDIAKALGPFDVAMIPINGARQNAGRFHDLGAPGVLTPSLAVTAARALEARLTVPIHFGHHDPGQGYFEVNDSLQKFEAEAQIQGVDIQVMRPGESIEI